MSRATVSVRLVVQADDSQGQAVDTQVRADPRLTIVVVPGRAPTESPSAPTAPVVDENSLASHHDTRAVASPSGLSAEVIDRVRASRHAQGLSLGVTDPALLSALRRTLMPPRDARDKNSSAQRYRPRS